MPSVISYPYYSYPIILSWNYIKPTLTFIPPKFFIIMFYFNNRDTTKQRPLQAVCWYSRGGEGSGHTFSVNILHSRNGTLQCGDVKAAKTPSSRAQEHQQDARVKGPRTLFDQGGVSGFRLYPYSICPSPSFHSTCISLIFSATVPIYYLNFRFVHFLN